jgi:hypothetical protein
MPFLLSLVVCDLQNSMLLQYIFEKMMRQASRFSVSTNRWILRRLAMSSATKFNLEAASSGDQVVMAPAVSLLFPPSSKSWAR